MAEIDDITVSTLKSITLATLLKIVQRQAPLEPKMVTQAQAGPGAEAAAS